MRAALDPFSFVVISIAGWMNQHQQHLVDHLIEENRVLREHVGGEFQIWLVSRTFRFFHYKNMNELSYSELK
jgi:hypothetical protein